MMQGYGTLVKCGPAQPEAAKKMTTLTDMMRRAREDDPASMRDLGRELVRRGYVIVDVNAVATEALERAHRACAEASNRLPDGVSVHLSTAMMMRSESRLAGHLRVHINQHRGNPVQVTLKFRATISELTVARVLDMARTSKWVTG